MHIIKTEEDLQTLRKSKALTGSFVEYLFSEFISLREALNDSDSKSTFTLQPHGYIVILERGDHNQLASVGLGEGLLNCWPEYIERIELPSLSVYKIGVLYSNDYMMMFYTQVGIHDEEVEAWLAEQCID